MIRRRVVITGTGAVCPAGIGKHPFWEALITGKSLLRRIDRFDVSDYRTQIAAYLDESSIPFTARKTDINLWDLSASIALLAAREAIAESGFAVLPSNAASIMGSAVSGITSLDAQFENFYVRGKRFVMPYTVPRTMLNAPSSLTAIELGICGSNYMIGTACSSSSQAIGLAYRLISAGFFDLALAGGTECPVSPGHLQAWDRLRALSNDNDTPCRACRPFSKNRNGLSLGEGAGMLVIEDFDSARERGAGILAEIVGFGSNNDAVEVLQPSVDSQASCIRAALKDAEIADRIPDYICAHATGTRDGDRKEAEAIRTCFSSNHSSISVSSIKAIVGHTLGASGALAVIAAVMAMKENLIPATANLEEDDPDCELNHVTVSQNREVDLALVHSFAFGGSNAVLALKKS